MLVKLLSGMVVVIAPSSRDDLSQRGKDPDALIGIIENGVEREVRARDLDFEASIHPMYVDVFSMDLC